MTIQKNILTVFAAIFLFTNNILLASDNINKGQYQKKSSSSSAGADKIFEKIAEAKCSIAKGKFPWNFEKAKLLDVVNQVSRLTCKNFIISSEINLNAEITILSRTEITIEQAWQAFLSSLEANKFSIVKAGDFYKIIRRKDAPQSLISVYDSKKKLPYSEQVVTAIYNLEHITKDSVRSLVKNLISKTGEVDTIGSATFVISDSAANIHRIINILDRVDVAGASSRIHTIDVLYGEAVLLQKKLTEIFDVKTKRGRIPFRRGGDDFNSVAVDKIIADERTNKIIIIASDKSFAKIKEVVAMLDAPPADLDSQGEIHVIYLNNAKSQEMAQTLANLVQKNNFGFRGRAGGPPIGARASSEKVSLFEGDVKITADQSTNSLVVVASPKDFREVQKIIKKLDRARTQVYIEAVVMELHVDSKTEVGIKAVSGIPVDKIGIPGTALFNMNGEGLVGGLAKGVMSGGANAMLSALPALLQGGQMTLSGPEFSSGALKGVPQFLMSLKANKGNNDFDILATPHILTLDNSKAEIVVGEKIPVVKGVSPISGILNNSNVMQSIGWENANLKFVITPHVNKSGNIRMEIEQEVNDIGPAVISAQNNPSILTKSLKTTVVSKDQETIVLGGLISKKDKKSEKKIPILGDIPVIGRLFSSTTVEKVRKNLLLILTPHIIKDESDYRRIYKKKMKDREDFAKKNYGKNYKKYDRYIDYSRKNGALMSLFEAIDLEMQRAENGGSGLKGEVIIRQQKPNIKPAAEQLLKKQSAEKAIIIPAKSTEKKA